VKPEQVRGAVNALSMISHAGEASNGELGVGSQELGIINGKDL
jgi:hypothetical protein